MVGSIVGIMILAVKSVNGHAMAFEPPIRTVLIDIIHLLAAALWAGGLLYILVYWKKQQGSCTTILVDFLESSFSKYNRSNRDRNCFNLHLFTQS